MHERKHTFCRICEPHCPMLATVEAGRVVHLAPDRNHPAGGMACHKGLAYLEIHDDPDRLNQPARRASSKQETGGRFQDIGWEEVIAEIGERIRTLQAEHGKDSIAVYLGNPAAFNGAGLMMVGQFQDALETRMRFGANSQDAANKFAVTSAVYGAAESLMVPDIYNTHYLLCLGTNPKVSRWTSLASPNDWDVVKGIRSRGGKIRFVNPRRTESSSPDTGPTLLIRPGTDVYFLAAILHHIDRTAGFDPAMIARHCRNVDGLRAFISHFDAERVAPVTGISATATREIAEEIVAAPSAAIMAATGVNQSRQGVLAFWLAEMIHVATGNLGRAGGAFKPRGVVNHFAPVRGTRALETSLGALELPDPPGFAVLPGALMPDLIANGDLRALIVIGGNPLLSSPGGESAREAYKALDLLVSIDLYRNATGELADYILPASDWLERPDVNVLNNGMQSIPYAQYTDAMVPPAAGRRNEWWILARLAQAIGAPSPLDEHPTDENGEHMVDAFLAASGLSRASLKAEPSQTALLPEEPRDTLFERCLQHPDGKIDCYPDRFATSGLVSRCHDIFAELLAEPPHALKLITLRTPYMHNSWFANSPRFRRSQHAENALHMCEADAQTLSLLHGDRVVVSTAFGRVETDLAIDNDLGRGTVALTHGFGHTHSFALTVAQEHPGVNSNALMPFGAEQFEPLSHMSWISGVPVTVKLADTPAEKSAPADLQVA